MIFLGQIYHREIPAFLMPYLESEAMKRLEHVDMNCGMNYTSYRRFVNIEAYSRFHHSLGCALIVWHFTRDKAQTLAALFHDIATQVFSHVVDFVYGDYEKQETTEARTALIIESDPDIMAQLKKDNIDVSLVSDYHIYPVADNDSPRLCADRLEYILGDLSDFRMADEETIRRLYSAVTVLKNEDGQAELGFSDENTACEFASYALECGRIYSGDENRFAMEQLAAIIRSALNRKILLPDDLFGREKDVIAVLRNSDLAEAFAHFQACSQVIEADPSDPDAVSVSAKKRYVDPLCSNGFRVSALNREINEAIRDFINLDYSCYVKGVINE